MLIHIKEKNIQNFNKLIILHWFHHKINNKKIVLKNHCINKKNNNNKKNKNKNKKSKKIKKKNSNQRISVKIRRKKNQII